MKFYGTGLVWNVKINKADIEFVNGVYETKNPEEIERLKLLGYDFDIENVSPEPEEFSSYSKKELIEKAISLNIGKPSYLNRMKKDDLLDLLNEYKKD